jgi:hypothetical protein
VPVLEEIINRPDRYLLGAAAFYDRITPLFSDLSSHRSGFDPSVGQRDVLQVTDGVELALAIQTVSKRPVRLAAIPKAKVKPISIRVSSRLSSLDDGLDAFVSQLAHGENFPAVTQDEFWLPLWLPFWLPQL